MSISAVHYLLLCALVFTGSACGSSEEAILKKDVSRQVTPENESELRHAKIRLGMTPEEVRKIIGSPGEVDPGRKPTGEDWMYWELVVHDPPKLRAFAIWFVDNKVVKTHVIN